MIHRNAHYSGHGIPKNSTTENTAITNRVIIQCLTQTTTDGGKSRLIQPSWFPWQRQAEWGKLDLQFPPFILRQTIAELLKTRVPDETEKFLYTQRPETNREPVWQHYTRNKSTSFVTVYYQQTFQSVFLAHVQKLSYNSCLLYSNGQLFSKFKTIFTYPSTTQSYSYRHTLHSRSIILRSENNECSLVTFPYTSHVSTVSRRRLTLE